MIDNINEEINKLSREQEWNHLFNLDDKISTLNERKKNSQGNNEIKFKRLLNVVDLSFFENKTVIDYGCSDGYFSLEISKNAKSVTGIDIDKTRIKKANLIKKYYDINNCAFKRISYNNLNGKYDIGLALGILHRVQNPIEFINKICSQNETIIIEYKRYKSNKNLILFAGNESKSNKHNALGYIFSYQALAAVLKDNQFQIIKKENIKMFYKLKYPRHIIVAKRI